MDKHWAYTVKHAHIREINDRYIHLYTFIYTYLCTFIHKNGIDESCFSWKCDKLRGFGTGKDYIMFQNIFTPRLMIFCYLAKWKVCWIRSCIAEDNDDNITAFPETTQIDDNDDGRDEILLLWILYPDFLYEQ